MLLAFIKRTNRVRRIFKWAAGEEPVPGAVWQGLRAVERFQAGRTSAPETDPAGPVPPWAVNATLPDLRPEVRAMVEFQRLTGCRPGDAIRQRPAPLTERRPGLHGRAPAVPGSHRLGRRPQRAEAAG